MNNLIKRKLREGENKKKIINAQVGGSVKSIASGNQLKLGDEDEESVDKQYQVNRQQNTTYLNITEMMSQPFMEHISEKSNESPFRQRGSQGETQSKVQHRKSGS